MKPAKSATSPLQSSYINITQAHNNYTAISRRAGQTPSNSFPAARRTADSGPEFRICQPTPVQQQTKSQPKSTEGTISHTRTVQLPITANLITRQHVISQLSLS
ncbi:hypothetical protein Nepgr_017993 [Nepenthes gracilis]|uniref:Uncharacterized protein n=1 Tax=Nepenthes gracilis TaxID=150966 RepID=A0AAD3XSP2_NEPGR|nr:hypothetical protein Nepgr_017993 [Nepenthes gracilis]